MFKNNCKNNICGEILRNLRLNYPSKLSQRELADKLQLIGIDVDKNAIQRIECGKRFVTDIELKAFSEIFGVSVNELLKWPIKNTAQSIQSLSCVFYSTF